MYPDFLVKIPISCGKITYRKKGKTDYIYYEYTRLYKKGSNITNPKRATIGKRDGEDPELTDEVKKDLTELCKQNKDSFSGSFYPTINELGTFRLIK